MFHIFSKKKFLVDALNGFVDIHNHILPGIDDGAKNIEDSMKLITSFSEIGIERFIATPHIMETSYPNTPHTIQQALAIVKNELNKKNLKNIKIEAAAEHMIDANFENLLERLEVMPIKKEYLLIEMSYLQASLNFDDAVKNITSHHYFPILAHPERYHYLHESNKYDTYKNKGILFQMNLLSLSPYYGGDVSKMAQKLLNKNLIDFFGTDVHNLKQLEALKAIKISDKLLKQILPIIERTVYTFD
jgi:tyrosine-protein phosphatase YwqE